MLTTNIELEQWKEYMYSYQNQRKNLGYEYGRPQKISHSVVKNKDCEFNPLLIQYKDPIREEAVKAKISEPLETKKAKKQEITDKYMQPFDLITLEKNPRQSTPEDRLGRKRILPKAQVDYNILNNTEFGKDYWRGVD